MRIPLIIAIIASASIIIYWLVDTLSKTHIYENQIFGFLHVLGVFFFGLSIIWVAVNYD
jgi:hypothetical protein